MDEANPYLNVLQQQQVAQLRYSLQTAIGKPADQQAKLQALADQYQLPVSAVQLDSAALNHRAQLDKLDYAHLVTNLPATADLLANPQHAALAHDDIGNLSNLELALQGLKNSGKALLSGVYGFSEGVAGQAEAGAEFIRQHFTAPLAGTVLPVDIGAPVADAFKRLRQSQTAWRQYLTPPAADNLQAGFYAGLQSLTQNLLSLPLALATDNPQLALHSMALNTGGQAYGKARDQGLASDQSLVYGAADAAIEYATERLPLNQLFKDVKAGSALFSSIGKQLVREIPGEQAATALQDMNAWAVLHPEQSFADYLAQRPDAAVQTLIATLVGSGGQSGALHGLQQWAQRYQPALHSAGLQAARLQQLQQLATASKVAPRSPALIKQFVDNALANSAVQHIYVPAQAVADAGLSQRLAALLPDAGRQLADALAAGNEISIPLSDYVSRLASSDMLAPLLPHLRLEGESFSQHSAQNWLNQHADASLQAHLQAAQDAEQQHAHLAEQQQVQALIMQRLQAVSPFAEAANQHYATLVAHFYGVQAGRFGISPLALFQAYPLQIATGEEQPAGLASAAEGDDSVNNALPATSSDPSLAAAQAKPPEPGQNDESPPAFSPPQALTNHPDPNTSPHSPLLTATPSATNPPPAQAIPSAETMPSATTTPPNATITPSARTRGIYQPEARRIILNPAADLSTFLHEAAHFFLDMQFELSAQLLGDTATHSRGDKPSDLYQPRFGKSGDEIILLGPMFPDAFATAQADQPVKKKAKPKRKRLPDRPPEPEVFDPDWFEREMIRDDVPPGEYSSQTKMIVESTRLLGADKVRTPGQAAQAMAYLSRYANEHFDALVTDQDGIPLAIVGSFKGGRTQTPVIAETIASEAFRIKYAAHIWFAHNHPSGPNGVSPADRQVNLRLAQLFEGSEIESHGFLAINSASGNGRLWWHAPHPANLNAQPSKEPNLPSDNSGTTSPPVNTRLVPVMARVMVHDESLAAPLEYPLRTSHAIELAQNRAGILLINSDMNPKAYIPLNYVEMEQLRKKGRMDMLIRAFSVSNATGAVLINTGFFDAETVQNIAAFIYDLGLTLVDVLDVRFEKVKSRREQDPRQFNYVYNKGGFKQGPVPPAALDTQPDDTQSEQPPPEQAPTAEHHSAPPLTGQQQLLADSRLLLDWFGLDSLQDWQQLDIERKRQYHEQFAEGFERYLMEGKAPSAALQPLFERFKAWLLAIYHSLRNMRVQLNREVRGVFDRMLAADAAIRQAAPPPQFRTAEAAGMAPAEFARYQAQLEQARQQAASRLQSRVLQDMQWLQPDAERTARQAAHPRLASLLRRMQNRRESLRQPLRHAVRREVLQQPVYQARQFIQHTSGSGLPGDLLAELFGFSSGQQMQHALAAAPAAQTLIRQTSDSMMLAGYGNLATPGAWQQAVEQAWHNPQQAAVLETEAAKLALYADQPRYFGDTLPAYAAATLSRLKIREIQAASYRHQPPDVAENVNAAAQLKQQQLLNFYLAQQRYAAEQSVSEGLAQMRRCGQQLSIAAPYRKQIQALLARFGIIKLSGIAPLESLGDWLAAQQRLGLYPQIAPALLDSAYSLDYRELTIEQFQALRDAVQQIAQLSRLRKRCLAVPGKQSFSVWRRRVLHSLKQPDTATLPAPEELKDLSGLGKQVAALIRRLEGTEHGPLWQYAISTAQQHSDWEKRWQSQAAQSLAAILSPLLSHADYAAPARYYPAPGLSLNREQRLLLAMQTGNRGSLQALLAEHGWTQEQLNVLLQDMRSSEWLAVQQVWDYLDSLLPNVQTRQQRVYGIPAKVNRLLPILRHITPSVEPGANELARAADQAETLLLRGGYVPVFETIERINRQSGELGDISRDTRLSFFQTPAGFKHLQLRAQALGSGIPIAQRLRPAETVVFARTLAGVMEMIHDLVWQEWLVDMRRLFADAAVQHKLAEREAQALPLFRSWLNETQAGLDGAAHAVASAIQQFSQQQLAYAPLLQAYRAILQHSGLAQALAAIPSAYSAQAVSDFLAAAQRSAAFAATHSSIVTNCQPQPDTASLLLDCARHSAQVLCWQAAYQHKLADVSGELSLSAAHQQACEQADQSLTALQVPASPSAEFLNAMQRFKAWQYGQISPAAALPAADPIDIPAMLPQLSQLAVVDCWRTVLGLAEIPTDLNQLAAGLEKRQLSAHLPLLAGMPGVYRGLVTVERFYRELGI